MYKLSGSCHEVPTRGPEGAKSYEIRVQGDRFFVRTQVNVEFKPVKYKISMPSGCNGKSETVNCLLITKTFSFFRSSRSQMFYKIGILKNFAKLIGKHFFRSRKVAGVAGHRSATLLKKLQRRCFPLNFTKFLRTPFLQNTSGRQLLTF